MRRSTGRPYDEMSFDEAVAYCAPLLYSILLELAPPTQGAALDYRSSQPRAQPLCERIVEALERHGPLSPRKLRAVFGCAPMTLSRSLRKLITAGRIESIGQTKGRTYSLPPTKTQQ